MKTFSQYLTESKSGTVVFTFGRMNPPTSGHGKLLKAVETVAKKNKAEIRIYPSHTQNAKKDPLTQKQKIGYLSKMFPKLKRSIISKNDIKTPFQVLDDMPPGTKKVIMVVGGDRVDEFKSRMTPYVEKEQEYSFDVVSAGDRDPDDEGVEGMSASKMRAAVADDDFKSFRMGTPELSDKDSRAMFQDVKKGMKL